MSNFVTIYKSNFLVECYIVKGRIESEGIPCYLFDEKVISIHPFYAVALGGVKISVPAVFYQEAIRIMKSIDKGYLFDREGEYLVAEALQENFEKENEILKIKYYIRQSPDMLYNYQQWKTETITEEDCKEIILEEKLFQKVSKKEFVFEWNKFLIALFDPDVNFFQYLRTKPVEYFLDKEMVENILNTGSASSITCPYCHSSDAAFNYAVDYKWDFLYLFLSLISFMPFFPFRKKSYCFNCGRSF